ncbi:MAG TPA: serine/threonine-protein kinase [Pseudomonadota bacterium]|nr:serine/threonine-protein kinase [Pseudomonadota bacterium]
MAIAAVAKQCPLCRSVYSGGDRAFCPLDGTRLIDQSPSTVTTPEDPLIGRTIAGRFVLERRLGKGGMGVVYLAQHAVLKRPFAVKLLLREFTSNERALARFFREARVASSLDHPNIVSIYDYGQTDSAEPFLIMEYVEGVALLQVVRQSRTRNLLPAYAVQLLLQVARALEHAHQRGVVHRDIKPENLLVTTFQGQNDFIKILDFGVARVVGQPPLTRIGEEILGTPEFMAPELLTAAEVAPPVDLYALGIMLHDTIVGEAPFRGDITAILQGHVNQTPPLLSKRRRDIPIPRELDELCAALLAKDPAQRPTASETVQRLEELHAKLPKRAGLGSATPSPLTSDALTSAAPAGDGARTLIINPAALAGESGPATVALHPAEGPATMLLPAQAVRVSDLVKIADPAKRAEIDALEGEIESTCERQVRSVSRLALDLWGNPAVPTPAWPAEALTLWGRLQENHARVQRQNEQLTRLTEQARLAQGAADHKRRSLHQEILSLSERVQLERNLAASERQRLLDEIETHERSLAGVLQGLSGAQSSEIAGLRRGLREAQLEARNLYGELARQLRQAAAANPTHGSACQELAQQQHLIEAAGSMLSLLTRSITSSSPR